MAPPSDARTMALEAHEDPALLAALAEPPRPPATTARKAAAGLLAFAVVLYPLVFDQPYQQHLMIMIFIYALMAQGWNLLAGYCGQVSLGQAVYFGIGAYAAAFLFATFNVSPWIGMAVGVLVSVLVALAIGIPTFRLRGHYFAIATLVIGEIGQTIMLNWEAMGGATGIWIPIVREQPWFAFQFHASKLPNYYIGLGFLALACVVVGWLERNKPGLYFRAIRDEPEAAQSLGIDMTRYKLVAIAISAAFTSIAGTQFAQLRPGDRPGDGVPADPFHPGGAVHHAGRHRHHVGADHRRRDPVPAVGTDPGLFRRHRKRGGPGDLRRPHCADIGALSAGPDRTVSQAVAGTHRCLRWSA